MDAVTVADRLSAHDLWKSLPPGMLRTVLYHAMYAESYPEAGYTPEALSVSRRVIINHRDEEAREPLVAEAMQLLTSCRWYQ